MSSARKDCIIECIGVIHLDGGIDLKKVILAVVILSAFIGLSAAYDYSNLLKGGIIERNSTFDLEQSVQGNGYFMTYMYVKEGNVAVKNYAHGSGSINNEALLSAYSKNNTYHLWGVDWQDYNQNCIQFSEDNAMVYAPMRIAVGTGYYAANPIDYSSLLKERTEVKNWRAATSVLHEVEYAHAIDKELSVIAKENWYHIYDPVLNATGAINFKVNEDVTDGKTHFGVLQGSVQPVIKPRDQDSISDYVSNDVTSSIGFATRAFRKPSIEIDEDYWGTYHIEKNVTLVVPYRKITYSEDWLACPCGSVLDALIAQPYYLKGSKGFGSNPIPIFDCTCPSILTQAQNPRVYV